MMVFSSSSIAMAAFLSRSLVNQYESIPDYIELALVFI
jgi:hypothetical protein